MIKTREELTLDILTADWHSLRAHLERGGVIVVDGSLDLVDVAVKVAEDYASIIGQWINNGFLCKPAAEQIAEWDCNKQKCFRMLIISPYILIQE